MPQQRSSLPECSAALHFYGPLGLPHLGSADRTICIVGNPVAHQRARVAAMVVGNRNAVIFSDYVRVKIHQPLSADARGICSHTVSTVAYRAAKAVLRYVQAVLREAGVSDNLRQVVTLRAHSIRPGEGQVGSGKKVRDHSTRRRSLAELIVAFEDVRVVRSVRTVRPGAAELAIVVAVVAIGAEDARSHHARRRRSILIQQVQQEAGLRQGTGSIMSHRVARRCRRSEFRNNVQRIWCRCHSRWRIPVDDQPLLARARAVAAQTIFILIDRRSKNGDTIQCADSGNTRLRRT